MMNEVVIGVYGKGEPTSGTQTSSVSTGGPASNQKSLIEDLNEKKEAVSRDQRRRPRNRLSNKRKERLRKRRKEEKTTEDKEEKKSE